MLNVICKIVKIYQKVNYFNLILKIFITLMKIKLTLIKMEKMILILILLTLSWMGEGGKKVPYQFFSFTIPPDLVPKTFWLLVLTLLPQPC